MQAQTNEQPNPHQMPQPAGVLGQERIVIQTKKDSKVSMKSEKHSKNRKRIKQTQDALVMVGNQLQRLKGSWLAPMPKQKKQKMPDARYLDRC